MKLIITLDGQTTEFEPNPDLGVITFGRAETCDIALVGEKAASRQHGSLERTVDGWKLIDQMSANGTSVNGEKVNFAFLKEGDVIQIGRSTIKVTGLAPVPGANKAPARPAPARRVAPVAAVTEGERPMAYIPPRKSPAPAIVAACAVLLVLLGGGWFVLTQTGGSVDTPSVASGDPEKRKAELSDEERAVLTLAREITESEGDTLGRIKRLEQLEQSLADKRGTVARGEVADMKKSLLRQLDGEVVMRIDNDIVMAQMQARDQQFGDAMATITALERWLAADTYVAGLARNGKSRIEKARKETQDANSRFVNEGLREVARHTDARRFDDALAVIEVIRRQAWLDEELRTTLDREIERVNASREAAPKQPEGPVVEEKPSILGKVKEEEKRLPGKNPLLPDGPRSEAKLIAALHNRMIQACIDKKLTDDSFAWKGDKARIRGATKERLQLDVFTKDKKTGEELGFRTQVKWEDIKPADRLQLYDRTPALTPEDLLAATIYAFDSGLMDDAAMRACRTWKARNEWKEGIDNLIATKRKMAIPEGGFVEFEGSLIAPEEKEDFLFRRNLKAVLDRFEKGISSKDKKRREEAETAFNELLAMGERAVPGAIIILQEVLDKEMVKAENAAGLLSADKSKMDALLTELDKRRAHALELIMDSVRYPYPYGPNQAEVQAEVNARVAAVREIWNDSTSFLGQSNPEYEAVIEKVRNISERMDRLDPSNAYHKSTSEETIEYLRGEANKKLTIRNYAGSTKKYEALINYNRKAMEYNENFPTGEGHYDGDGRLQVKITNEYRIMFARHALKLNDKLFWGAWHHSKYCVEHNGGQIAHVIQGEPRGATPAERMAYEGYSGGGGENIHMNSAGPTAQSSHDAWCNSSGHHRNILTPGWRVLGSGKFRTIWTQKFGSTDEGDGNSVSKGGQ
ncbi:MAG: FHA domain-containing protein [Planctomycetes bacterium]|nr:FHA domain-containing protein [Planctomycetota bacterium]MCW8134200.1 FHA domain-containing protein [Planctomycetota bacterium]